MSTLTGKIGNGKVKTTLKLQTPAAPKTRIYPAVFAIPRGQRWHHRGCHQKCQARWRCVTCFAGFHPALVQCYGQPCCETHARAQSVDPRSASQLGHHSGLGIAHSTTYGDQQVDRTTWNRCRSQPSLKAHIRTTFGWPRKRPTSNGIVAHIPT